MNKHGDTVNLNHADIFTPALTRIHTYHAPTIIIMMTKAELDIMTRAASHEEELQHCVVVFENTHMRMWIHSFRDMETAIKTAIASKTWGVDWSLFSKHM